MAYGFAMGVSSPCSSSEDVAEGVSLFRSFPLWETECFFKSDGEGETKVDITFFSFLVGETLDKARDK